MSARADCAGPRGLSGVGLLQKAGDLLNFLIYIYHLVVFGVFLVILKAVTLMLGNIEDRRRRDYRG